MGEALMFRAGSEFKGPTSWGLVTEIFDSNTSYTVPYNVKDNLFHVRIFGGGGGGIEGYNYSNTNVRCASGGGGWMNNAWLELTPGSIVNIRIGSGGNYRNFGSTQMTNGTVGYSGGTTSFGTYLSANGGGAGNIGMEQSTGGSGGSGGGAYSYRSYAYGGRGYQFGGGGANSSQASKSVGGSGGEWGGNGGNCNISANNGINTIAIIDESDEINRYGIGYGIGGKNCGGGGGYGANGGTINSSISFAGGGGYGNAGYGAGGGGYGKGVSSTTGSGKGAAGICLIHYYQAVL